MNPVTEVHTLNLLFNLLRAFFLGSSRLTVLPASWRTAGRRFFEPGGRPGPGLPGFGPSARSGSGWPMFRNAGQADWPACPPSDGVDRVEPVHQVAKLPGPGRLAHSSQSLLTAFLAVNNVPMGVNERLRMAVHRSG